jgi:8-oxo-dGTP diphosphatase
MNEEFKIDVKVGRFFSESIYSYDTGTIQLLVYWVIWQGNSLNPVVHEEIAWVDKETILNYQFAPADIPIVEKLRCHEGDLLICT